MYDTKKDRQRERDPGLSGRGEARGRKNTEGSEEECQEFRHYCLPLVEKRGRGESQKTFIFYLPSLPKGAKVAILFEFYYFRWLAFYMHMHAKLSAKRCTVSNGKWWVILYPRHRLAPRIPKGGGERAHLLPILPLGFVL